MNNEVKSMEDAKKIIESLKTWVKENYNPRATGYTIERSRGNYDDVFEDGCEYGTSWSAYEVGSILGMELEEPDEADED